MSRTILFRSGFEVKAAVGEQVDVGVTRHQTV
jgi:hypothetical protein